MNLQNQTKLNSFSEWGVLSQNIYNVNDFLMSFLDKMETIQLNDKTMSHISE